MLSIIVCSINENNFLKFSENVMDTVGVEFEIIRIDNKIENISLSMAYNRGASMAKYAYLVFVHEDVKMLTENWGQNLVAHFKHDTNTGVIGLAGSIYKTRMFSSWWQSEINGLEPKRINIIQTFKFGNKADEHLHVNPLNEVRSRVVALDGVFMAVEATKWAQFKFDEVVLKGFHGYDLDFSLKIGLHFTNYVVYDILLEHFSEGHLNPHWISDIIKIHCKFRPHLPLQKSGLISDAGFNDAEKDNLRRAVNQVAGAPVNKAQLLKLVTRFILAFRLYKPNKIFIKMLLKRMFS